MTKKCIYIMLGVATGVLSGLIGIGGGTIIMPVLVLVVGFSLHQAQGTHPGILGSPIGILAAGTYYKRGF
jgi:hypothetical protein